MKCSKCNAKLVGPDLVCPNCEYDMENKTEGTKRFEVFSKYSHKRKNYKPKKGISAIIGFYKDSFDFQGYSSRLEYWTQQLYLTLILVPIFILLLFFPELILGLSSVGKLIFWIYVYFVVFSAFPNVSATVRRLNDAGYSGRMYFMGYIPLVGNFILLFATLEPSEE